MSIFILIMCCLCQCSGNSEFLKVNSATIIEKDHCKAFSKFQFIISYFCIYLYGFSRLLD
jgi:hypothetical protein